jgi:hypothetical protein
MTESSHGPSPDDPTPPENCLRRHVPLRSHVEHDRDGKADAAANQRAD